jgi:outer membrane protein
MRSRQISHRLSSVRRWAWLLGLNFAMGCAHEQTDLRDDLAVQPAPAESAGARQDSRKAVLAEVKPLPSDSMVSRTQASREVDGRKAAPGGTDSTDLPPALEGAAPMTSLVRQPATPATSLIESPESAELDAIAASGRPLSLPEAIALAFRHQPRLRAQLETISQARGRQEIVGSTFLPTAGVSGSVGGYEVNAGGIPVSTGLKAPPGFTFLPSTGVLPIGFHVTSGYELVDLKLQWLITDFGRRLGRFEQAKLSVAVAQLQTDRAFQTVSNEVSVAYYDVLKAQAFRLTAEDAIRRAEDQLSDARKLEREGVVERETVLRAEVLMAETRQQLHGAIEASFVALAELNLAIGLKCGEPIRVVEPADLPPFNLALSDCLQSAIRERREFQVAKRAVEISQAGTRIAKAEFAPKVMAAGDLLDIRQNSNSGHGDVALGFIRVEWEIFEGGRRVAERRVADSRLREAMAHAESIADNIAFQVNEAYRRMAAARLGIEDARPAVEQAGENYRLVRLRAREGSATTAEITDAQASLTRAQQNYQNALYAYLTAIARLEYAMGSSPTPVTLANGKP